MNTDRIEKKILLHASLHRVWQAVADSAEFGSWFGMKFDGPFVPGSALRGRIVPTTVDPAVGESQQEYDGLQVEILVEQMEPEKLFSFRWHPFAVEQDVDYSTEPTTLVAFTLEESSGGVILTVTESGFDRIPLARRAKAITANDAGWAAQMKLIEEYLVHAP